ncbi:MAG: FAD-dependent thymidylate synthase, partial [Acidobacteriales bacterium]|nr:FAD-dependent thymidylate synthase [Terriglobales bacterium]
MPDSKNGNPPASTNVYAVHGAEPEVQAYAMAKYSRSALSMKESLAEINEQKAEKFLNTFYFQYGHRSIADLAHIALAIEKLSILAAIVLVDEQRWDGQERSTRYQDFRKSGYYTPDFGGDDASRALYRDTIEFLFAEYEQISELMWRYLADRTPKPDDMKPEVYERTLRARAFDISRYLLPLATNTSLGQIVNSRTLESQISRLLSHTHAEVRTLGELLKEAARTAAYNVNQGSWHELVEQIRSQNQELGARAEALLLKPVRVSPTLVKYADSNAYETNTRVELTQAAHELMKAAAVEPAKTVDLLDDDPLEIELASTLLYQHCHYPYRQIRQRVESLSASRRQEIVDLGVKHRSRHDELLRAYCSGQRFRFDILMDVGGFRDMHRHRRCVQIMQPFAGTLHSYDTPDDLVSAGLEPRYNSAMARISEAGSRLQTNTPEAQASHYLPPMAFR